MKQVSFTCGIVLFLFSSLLGMGLILFYFRGYIFPVNQKPNQQQKTTFPTAEFSLQKAPSQSLIGNIISFSGSVGWQSRIGTEPAQLTTLVPIQQGEKIVTADKGNITIEFPNGLSIMVLPKAEINFIQTLSNNFVVQQEQGTISYSKTNTNPLAIRSLSLLTQFTNGDVNVSINKDKSLVTIEVNKGEVTIAYNDLQNISQLQTVTFGQQLVFNQTTKKVSIKPKR